VPSRNAARSGRARSRSGARRRQDDPSWGYTARPGTSPFSRAPHSPKERVCARPRWLRVADFPARGRRSPATPDAPLRHITNTDERIGRGTATALGRGRMGGGHHPPEFMLLPRASLTAA
jgi:hypothetical protein